MKKRCRWYMIVTGGILFLTGLLFLIKGQNLKLPVEEVLDRVIMPFRAIRNDKIFFDNDEYVGYFGGIERYFYPSGWKAYSLLYMSLPPFSAYVAGRFLSILLSVFGTVLMVSEMAGEEDGQKPGTKALGWLLGLSWGLIAFPPVSAFGFASLPLLFYLLLRVAKRPRFPLFLLIFLYPCLSDLFTTGILVFAGTILFFLCRWIAKKKFPWPVLLSLFLMAGCFVLTEYHFLFDFVFEDLEYVVFHWDTFLDALWYYPAVLLFAALLAFFLLLLRKGKEKVSSVLLTVLAVLPLFLPLRYNEVFHNLIPDRSGEHASYRGFFSRSLFEEAKQDLFYDGEWAVTCGIDPAVLTYNGINTLDGYFDVYSINYQDYCRRVIAPTFEKDPGGSLEEAYDKDNRGFFLSSVNGEDSDSRPLYIDTNALKDLGGRYVFSAYEISNAQELGLDPAGDFAEEGSPYHLRVYITHSRYKDKVTSDVPFAERSYDDFDLDRIHELEGQMEELAAAAEGKDEVSDLQEMDRLFVETHDELLKYMTAMRILNVHSDMDIKNDELSDLYHERYEVFLDETDHFNQILRSVCLTPYSEVIRRRYSTSMVDSLAEYEDMTEEEKERSLRIESLEHEYEEASLEPYYFEYQGELWDEEKLDAAEDLDRETYLDIYYGISNEKASALGEIYLELLELHHEQALDEDYDSYADYAYENVYIRDYDVDETKKMLKEIRGKGSRFITAVSLLKDEHETDYGVLTENDRETYEMLLPYMEDIDPELSASLQHLLVCGLYDLNYNEAKVGSTGYTTTFPSYGDGFIFDSPYRNTVDLFTYVHEFGHYHHNSHDTAGLLDFVNNVDVDEIHSQGLEMLFTAYYPEIYGQEMGKDLEFIEVSNMMTGIPDMAIVAEFEIYAHEHAGKLTVEDLNKKYLDLYEDFGFTFSSDWEGLPMWVDIPHIFSSPNYYISYLTSAMTSLEIYNLSKRDRKEAIEKYMELTGYPGSAAYSAVVEETGLSDIFEKGKSSEILRDTYRFLKFE